MHFLLLRTVGARFCFILLLKSHARASSYSYSLFYCIGSWLLPAKCLLILFMSPSPLPTHTHARADCFLILIPQTHSNHSEIFSEYSLFLNIHSKKSRFVCERMYFKLHTCCCVARIILFLTLSLCPIFY